MTKRFAILGCGNMGQAFLASLISNKVYQPEEIIVCNRTKEKNEKIRRKFGVHTTTNPNELKNLEILLLGIKPQGINDLNLSVSPETIIISILAGVMTSTLEEKIKSNKIVRFMPNLGQYCNKGVTEIYYNEQHFSTKERAMIQNITAGTLPVMTKDEAELDALTAISGCGPGYFFAFAEALQKSAEKLGADPKTAFEMTKQTFLGAAQYFENADQTFTEAIQTVASKGGMTNEALQVFAEKNLNEIVDEGVAAAIKRAEELSKS